MQTKLDLDTSAEKVPTFVEVRGDLEHLPALLYECIEAGVMRGRAVAIEERFAEDPLDPWLVSTVLRGRVRKMLKKHGVESTADGPFNLSSQPLIGLLFHFKGYSFRILKAVSGKAPGYGNSQPRKRFYDQVPTKYRSREGKICASKLNLLVLYDEDEKGASSLILACPSIGARFSHEVAYHWIEKLRHPSEIPNVPASSVAIEPDPLDALVQRIESPSEKKKKA